MVALGYDCDDEIQYRDMELHELLQLQDLYAGGDVDRMSAEECSIAADELIKIIDEMTRRALLTGRTA